MSVTVERGATFRAGVPQPLFDDSFGSFVRYSTNYDVAPDAQRFLMIEEPDAVIRSNHFVVIPDFAGEVRERLLAAAK